MKFLNSLFLKRKIIFYILLFINIRLTINIDPNCGGCNVENNKCELKDECKNNPDPIPENCICNENCRPHLYNNECFDCTEAFSSSNSKLYSIEGETCSSKSISDCNKIIIETNECVNDCSSSGFEFGDYCYSSCEETLGMETDTAINRKCKCKDNLYIIEEIIQNKKYLRCTKTCPSGYYNYRTKYCIKNIENCEGDLDKIINNNGCTDSCNDNNLFLYSENEKINGNLITKKYCLEKCPYQKMFYYEKSYGEKECLSECKKGDFYSEEGECKSDCGNKMILIDINANIYKCTDIDIPDSSTNYECGETEFPYQYKNYCLRSCNDTQNSDFFYKKTTYMLTIKDNDNNINKFCSEDCTEDGENQKYFNKITLSCHKDCEETTNKFNFENECINSCTELKNYQLYLSDTKKCVVQCEGEYRLSRKENICYKNYCQDSEYKYIDESNECNTCNIPQNPNNIVNGEGYILEEEIDGNNVLKCLKYCSKKITNIDEGGNEKISEEKYYHNDKDNNCLSHISQGEGCENNNEYKYYIGKEDEIDYICYKSCKDIPGNYIYQYEFKCYKEPEENDFSDYYYIESGIYKYIKEEEKVVEICSKKGLYYFKNGNDKECIKECNTGEYRILYSTDQNGIFESLGKCLDSCPTDENSNIFYKEDEKICYQNCPYKGILKKQMDDTYKPITDQENCVIKCPIKYPFESKDGKNCYDVCPDNFYIEMNGKKICVDNCDNKYYFEGEFKCLDKCSKTINGEIIYYYYKKKK